MGFYLSFRAGNVALRVGSGRKTSLILEKKIRLWKIYKVKYLKYTMSININKLSFI